MHDIRWIRENTPEFARGLERRGMPGDAGRALIDNLLSLDERRRGAIAALEQAQARRNTASREIGQAKAKKDETRAQALMGEVAQLKDRIPDLEKSAKALEAELDNTLAQLPNLPADDVPDGADETANVERHKFGAKRDYALAPKQHFDLGEALRQMDFEAAARLSGARFVVLKKGLARMERALAQFMLDLHTSEHGYTEVSPPLLVRDHVMFGTAQLPKFENDQFEIPLAPFEAVMERVKSKAIEGFSKVQAGYFEKTQKLMTTEEALSSFYDGLKAGMPEYRKLYEAETGRAHAYGSSPRRRCR